MGRLLVVDGSDICRAPIVEFTLRGSFSETDRLLGTQVESRGLTAERDRTMCASAATRLGFTGPAIAFYGAHRPIPLSVDDIAGADLVLTAERAQRSAVVRMLPGTQAMVFTWKEALALASALVERRRVCTLSAAADLSALARSLHSARGTVPLIEPAARTGAFHRRRAAPVDPLTIQSGHAGHAEHRRVTEESVQVAAMLAVRFVELAHPRVPMLTVDPVRGRVRRARRSA